MNELDEGISIGNYPLSLVLCNTLANERSATLVVMRRNLVDIAINSEEAPLPSEGIRNIHSFPPNRIPAPIQSLPYASKHRIHPDISVYRLSLDDNQDSVVGEDFAAGIATNASSEPQGSDDGNRLHFETAKTTTRGNNHLLWH